MGKNASVNFFIAAALLVVFGLSARPQSPTDGNVQIALGVAMLAAGLFLRAGTAQSLVVGLAAAGSVCLFGAYDLFTGNGYVPGTIVAAFGFVRLLGAQADFGGVTDGSGQAVPYGVPYGALIPQAQQPYLQQPYPQAAYPQQAYPQAPYPEQSPPPAPAPWAPPVGGPAPMPAPAPIQPPPPVADPTV